MTNMTDIISTVDHAAIQNDRWMFVAVLIIAVAAMVMFWRWVIGDREKVAIRLTEITDRHIESVERMGNVVANNTVALHEGQAVTAQNMALLREVQGAITFCRERNRQ